jgi:Chaperone for flagella basal body P-ring formation
MRHSLRSWGGHALCWISVLSLSAAAATGSARTACYSTPSAAMDSVKPGSSSSPVSEGGGYRVTGGQSDPVLGGNWAIVASCDHTDWPVLAIRTFGSDLVIPSVAGQMRVMGVGPIPVVHAGDVVRLWKKEDLLRIEVAGIAEESGGLGKTIRVRLLRRNADDQVNQERFSGIVRGPSDVEMQP